MREPGRISAALEVLGDFEQRRVPLKVALADWARGARYAGSKDRAFISGLCLDVLRRKRSLDALGGGLRVGVAVTLGTWGRSQSDIEAAFADESHGPGSVSPEELEQLQANLDPAGAVGANVPDFCWPMLERVTDDPVAEGQASATRAPFDLRVNAAKAVPEKVLAALANYALAPSEFTSDGLRIYTEQSDTKAPQLTVTPAYNKGWIEVQDEGSQLAALASGPVEGAQVLDFCAGGGGKTLALASRMANSGQIYAYDNDAARLAPIFERITRAGIRNAQVISPAESIAKLDDIRGRMDVVFVDAPCSGSGTWRRRPDTKWRLTEDQLARRMQEQDQVLAAAAQYVRPGGALVFVTCSLFAEENDDRVAAFLGAHGEFEVDDPVAAMAASGGLKEGAAAKLSSNVAAPGVLRLSPHRTNTDGFGVTRLLRHK